MRQNDFERYRRYCTVKIQRIRKRIDFLNKHGKQYQKLDFTIANVVDAEALFYPLLNAERAWAYASELKEELNDTRNIRIRHHLISRIKKATMWAEMFMDMCHKLADDRTALESDAYFYFMKGNEGMEKGEWVRTGVVFEC